MPLIFWLCIQNYFSKVTDNVPLMTKTLLRLSFVTKNLYIFHQKNIKKYVKINLLCPSPHSAPPDFEKLYLFIDDKAVKMPRKNKQTKKNNIKTAPLSKLQNERLSRGTAVQHTGPLESRCLTTDDLQQAPVTMHIQLPGWISVFKEQFKNDTLDNTATLPFPTTNWTGGVRKISLRNSNWLLLTGGARPPWRRWQLISELRKHP